MSWWNYALEYGDDVIAIAGAYDQYSNGKDGPERIEQLQFGALDDASALMDAAFLEAAGLLEAGHHEAASHIIQAAKSASRHILEYSNLSIESQKEFYKIADSKLQPLVDQGMFAMDEYASMLGIPNSRGELVPYDVADLRETPGYQFQFQEGQRAVESSAVGRVLGGRQVKEQIRYGDGLAQLYFGQRLDQLAPLIQAGANAASQQASNAFNTGQGIAATQERTGGQLADISLTEGEGLANAALSTAGGLAELLLGNATNQANLAIGRGTAGANRVEGEIANRNQATEQIVSLFGDFASNYNNTQAEPTENTSGQRWWSDIFSGSTSSGAGQANAFTAYDDDDDFLTRTSVTGRNNYNRNNPFYGTAGY